MRPHDAAFTPVLLEHGCAESLQHFLCTAGAVLVVRYGDPGELLSVHDGSRPPVCQSSRFSSAVGSLSLSSTSAYYSGLEHVHLRLDCQASIRTVINICHICPIRMLSS